MKSKEVLLVNDDFHEVISIKGILDDLSSDHILHIVKSAQDALYVLMGNSTDPDSPVRKIMPDIILLKQNLPDMRGVEFLEIVRKYYSLDTIKIFLLIEPDAGIYQLMLDKLMITGCLQKPFEGNKNNSASIRLLRGELDPKRNDDAAPGFFAAIKAKLKTGLNDLKENVPDGKATALRYSAAPKSLEPAIDDAVAQTEQRDQSKP